MGGVKPGFSAVLAKILANWEKMGYNVPVKENRIVAVSGKLQLPGDLRG